MHFNLLALAIPFFVAFMLVEYYYSRKKKLTVFKFEEAIANLNIGIAERLTDLFTRVFFYFVFNWLYKHCALFIIRPTVITWLLLFLVTDFIWYWYHRFGHTVNLFWSAHVVHHQSDDFNYTTSVRITFFQSLARTLFWSILPVIGFPPIMITVFLLIHGAYPFFTHTHLIGKLGILEKFMVTPTHHGVHHSSNEEYLDKNYGDILIIWDKLFGTFAEEKSVPVYGLTAPLKSYSFLWQMFHFPLELLVSFKRANGWREKWKVLFGKPEDIDPRIRTFLERKFNIHAFSKSNSTLNYYIRAQTIITLAVLFFVLLLEFYFTKLQLITAFFFILVSVINTGAMMEQRRWIFYLEYVRLFLISVFVISIFPNDYVVTAAAGILLMVLLFYKTLSNRYYNVFYSCI
jgi:sterol desaturase/sphingolipid hydroxylase (fatty acid hydroxylase superfamily)